MFVLYKMDVLFLVKMITKMIENNVQLYPQNHQNVLFHVKYRIGHLMIKYKFFLLFLLMQDERN